MNDDLALDPNALERLGRLFRERGGLGADEPLSSRLISGGRSNLTYEVNSDRDAWVLRRPPMDHVLSTAHDMGREYRVHSETFRSTSLCPRPFSCPMT